MICVESHDLKDVLSRFGKRIHAFLSMETDERNKLAFGGSVVNLMMMAMEYFIMQRTNHKFMAPNFVFMAEVFCLV